LTSHLEDALDVNNDGVVDDDELLGLFERRDQIKWVSDSEYALFVSYAERLGEWRLGGSLKLVSQNVGEYSSFGIGMDVGLLRQGIWRNLDVGLKLQDITTTYLSWDTGRDEIIAPAIIPGLAYRVPLPQWDATVLIATSFETRFENRGDLADQYASGSMSMNMHSGLEVGVADKVFVRGGYDSGWKSKDFTAGAGFKLSRLLVDYAYAGDTLGISESTHRISLTVGF
jgi:hypothetical protein